MRTPKTKKDKSEKCPYCGGTGRDWETCADCQGYEPSDAVFGDEICRLCDGRGGTDLDCYYCGGTGIKP